MQEGSSDYYRLFGVSPGASHEEIKQAYRRLARQYHPDVSDHPEAGERFRLVAEAWAVLGDPERRRRYDRERRAAGRRPDASRTGAASEQGASAGPGPRMRDADRPAPGGWLSRLLARWRGRRGAAAPSVARVSLPIEAAHRGGERMLRVDGRRLRVQIPPGIADGGRIRLRGQGRGGADLLLEVRLQAEPPFRLEGGELVLELPLAPWEASEGARIRVPTPDGPVMLRVPAGSQSGRRLRLRGKGYAGGDLLVQLLVQLPAQPDETLQAAWQRLRAQGFDPRADWP